MREHPPSLIDDAGQGSELRRRFAELQERAGWPTDRAGLGEECSSCQVPMLYGHAFRERPHGEEVHREGCLWEKFEELLK